MHREWNLKTPFWEGEVFGRLTPPPEDILDMERGFFPFKSTVLDQQNSDATIECDSALLDLEFESICPGEFDCFKSGPTLAELNDTRSRSPLINPEMKRLHQAAILVGEVAEKSCENAFVKPRSHSVLEQQLKTQPMKSICPEQFFPTRNNCSMPLSSTVNRTETICAPGRDVRPAQTQQIAASTPAPSDERKIFTDGYKTQSVPPQLIYPQFGNGYSVSNGEYCISSTSSLARTAAHPLRQQQNGSVSGEEGSKTILHSNTEETTNEYQVSDDEDFESEEEAEEDTEEYCPFQKDWKTPARRKGRKSESEDMIPNPSKLLSIGRELDRLNKIISGLKPINELPQHSRGRSRKEKNKLASRACRLKKKQQHEANKVKLHGLESEQENLQFIINDMKNEIVSRARLPRKPASPLNQKFENMAKKALSQRIAGNTTEFVHKVLQEVAKGNHTGGLQLPPET